MKLTAIIAVALTIATAAAAATPTAGFYEAKRLEPAASWVAGKPVHAWCAKTRAAFTTLYTSMGGSATSDADAFASAVGGTDAYLAPNVCGTLLAWLNHRHVDDYTFAMDALTLAHKSAHLSGVAESGPPKSSSRRSVRRRSPSTSSRGRPFTARSCARRRWTSTSASLSATCSPGSARSRLPTFAARMCGR